MAGVGWVPLGRLDAARRQERGHGVVEAVREYLHPAFVEKGFRNVNRFRGGLVFKAHRLVYHSTLGSRVIKKNLHPAVMERGFRVGES